MEFLNADVSNGQEREIFDEEIAGTANNEPGVNILQPKRIFGNNIMKI